MPKRTDISTILIIGAGPIVIGQACEFDYSGTQAVKTLKEEGYRIVLVNSNPATIMTDPELADATYIEPITPEIVAKIIEKERHVVAGGFALLPTMGGQTALNCALSLRKQGTLEKFGVEMIGATADAIDKAEDRGRFREAMTRIGLETPRSKQTKNLPDALRALDEIGLPAIIRPSFTMGGTGGGIAYTKAEFIEIVERGIDASPTSEVLIEESVLGWKEYEMEVVRDRKDNCIIVCSIENLDPMGVHTGDSITVAPALTLTDKEYQIMRDASLAVLREIGVETGGSNVQFGVNPVDGRLVVIEMNPRVSRSSALASKATGFPIAKVAAKLAVGYTLDEIANDITGGATPASFEPTIDYVVTKIPRFAFEKFPGASTTLTTSMKSVGEVMAIGRTFQESLQKALRGLETGLTGLDQIEIDGLGKGDDKNAIRAALGTPTPNRLLQVAQAMRLGWSNDEIFTSCKIDPWFLAEIRGIVDMEAKVLAHGLPGNAFAMRSLKAMGFSDSRLAVLAGKTEAEVQSLRHTLGVRPVFKRIDTCAAEFASPTAYMYSTYEAPFAGAPVDESAPSAKDKIVILGGGPNRIGQGIEFDYCCCQASFALKEIGVESIMVNSNPETVSTDYDTSDKLYFEPLTKEDVLNIVATEKPLGLILQFGGQTPLNLAVPLGQAGVRIMGTPPAAIDRAEDRKLFKQMLNKLGLKQPPNDTATTVDQALAIAHSITYPVLVRPSYVLGGRAMQIVSDDAALVNFMNWALEASPDHPILIDKFLEDAIEVDVDAICDGHITVIGGIMEHIEEAGIHSGDSACVLPPYSLTRSIQEEIKQQTRALAAELGVIGLLNIQFAVKDHQVYVLEVNPRASRTVPFVSKATGVSLAKLATKVMLGHTLAELSFTREIEPPYFAVKESVFPFRRFPGVDPILGPEMRSTGEVMGLDVDFGLAFAKSQLAAGQIVPLEGGVVFSVKDADKPQAVSLAQGYQAEGFQIYATSGTAAFFRKQGLAVTEVFKVREGRPHIIDRIKSREISLLINTPEGRETTGDSHSIRLVALEHNIPYTTTMAAARATLDSIKAQKRGKLEVKTLQEYHEMINQATGPRRTTGK
ncbi:MAG: carbamoyl-phosphate synthase large subunit [Desulfobaccales bacterium]